ncbi:kinesin protein KIN-14N [Trifolium repens]|nr:kinesin protein KIN-14N [Trifolium repens]
MVGRPGPPELKGLIPRSLEQIFLVSLSLEDQGLKYTMQAPILEICNETIRDLLSPTENLGKKYNIIHDANGKNTYVQDLTIVDVCGADEISTLLQKATQSSLSAQSVIRLQISMMDLTVEIHGDAASLEECSFGIGGSTFSGSIHVVVQKVQCPTVKPLLCANTGRLEVLELFQEIKENLKEADKNDLEGMLNIKIQDLEIVEELRIKRADKHEIVNFGDLEIAISSENVVQCLGSTLLW